MNKYAIISIREAGEFRNFQSSIIVKVNPVEIFKIGSREVGGHYTSDECEETLWLIFRNNRITRNLHKLEFYAKACESGVFWELDLANWFEERETIINDNGKMHIQKLFVSRDHDEYFDEMEYYYQTHGNEAYSNFEEEQYIAQQRRRRDAGLMYDDYIDSFDEENEWDY